MVSYDEKHEALDKLIDRYIKYAEQHGEEYVPSAEILKDIKEDIWRLEDLEK